MTDYKQRPPTRAWESNYDKIFRKGGEADEIKESAVKPVPEHSNGEPRNDSGAPCNNNCQPERKG